jgi:hypothetical protein
MSSGHEMSNTGMLFIDAHGLKIRGGGVLEVFAKTPRGEGSRVLRKIARGGPPILCFIAFLLTSFSKICLGESLFHTPPSPLPPPVCIYDVIIKCIVRLV